MQPKYSEDEIQEMFELFTEEEKRKMKSLKDTSEEDWKHMKEIFLALYKDNLNTLCFRALKASNEAIYVLNGKQIHRTKKEPITPSKLRIVDALHRNRVRLCSSDIFDEAKRLRPTYINSTVTSCIANIVVQLKQKN